jgi:hypothetical protein
MAESEQRVDLLGAVEILHQYLTESLCDEVWEEIRGTERRRELVLSTLAEFWTAVVMRAPQSLTLALEEAAGSGGAAYPEIGVSKQAFFARCQNLRPEFFERLFEAFQARIEEGEPGSFASAHHEVASRFGGRIWAVDGSSLDKVARRLKVLRKDPRVPIPGTLIAFYDICGGSLARLHHTRELQPQEGKCVKRMLDQVPEGTLLIGDRLYGQPTYLGAISAQGSFALCRRHGGTSFEPERCLSKRKEGTTRIEDWVGSYGLSRKTERQQVRLIRIRKGKKVFELITNVLDPKKLSASEAQDLYRERWKIERLFYDLKVVLNLDRFYAGNINAVSMQVYSAAIVHLALRAAQARIAEEIGVEPEEISTHRLFLKVAAASSSLVIAELTFEAVVRANPGVDLNKPEWRNLPFASAKRSELLIRKRGPGGRKKRIKPDGRSLRRLPRP